MRRRWLGAVIAVIVGALAALAPAACAARTPSDPPGVTGEVTVFAASSLTETFRQIGVDFEAAYPGVRVRFSFAGSSALATQISQGAPVDVFAAASPTATRAVIDAGDADTTPVVFARNQLVIAVAKGNPHRIAGLRDLARPGLAVALCAEPVPCGAAAKRALAAAGVSLAPVTLERDVKAALAKVALGEVDAALVYRTDVRSASSDVGGVEFGESAAVANDYSIVVVKAAPNRSAGHAFVTFVGSQRGQAVLAAAGFLAPQQTPPELPGGR